jgi:hypothetical protein
MIYSVLEFVIPCVDAWLELRLKSRIVAPSLGPGQ